MITATRRVLILCCALMLALVPAATSDSPSAHAAGTVTLTGYGADSCTAPSESQMQAFWSNTPYSYWGIYIGGSDRGCSQPNLTSGWVSDMLGMGWDLLPIWVGPQNPCTAGQSSYFSENTATAYDQGVEQAKEAYQAWTSLSSVSDVPITYDLEAPSSDSATCRAAAQSFVNGWDAQLAVAPAQPSGVYSSACAGNIDDFSSIAHVPNYIDAADWDGTPSTGDISCVAANHWDKDQRHKQYEGGHNATYNGVTLNIDSDCANGPVYGDASRTSSTQACAPGSSASDAAVGVAIAAAGPVSWHGAQWSAGGPLSSQLLRNGAPVQVGSLPLVDSNVAPDAATVGAPMVLSDGSLVVPVTTHAAGTAQELIYTTTDGVHFDQRAAVHIVGGLGAGVGAPAGGRGGRSLYVVEPDAQHALVWTPAGGVHRIDVTGLPGVPSSVSFTSASDGAATAETTACADGKAGCAPTTQLFHTSDGGRSWH